MRTQPHPALGKRQYAHHIVTCVIFLLILLTIPLSASCSCKEELSGQDEIILQLKHDLNYIRGDGEEEEAMVRHAILQALGRGTEEIIERGDAGAQYDLGLCYAAGKGVDKNPTKAAKWYRLAADQGNAKAQVNLGLCYACGEGVNKDYTEAVKWCRLAAEQGMM